MSDLGGTARVIKGEPSATDTARLRRTLTDGHKAELREILGAALEDRTAGVLDEPPPQD